MQEFPPLELIIILFSSIAWALAKLSYLIIRSWMVEDYFDGLVQDCSNSSALAMELLWCYTVPLICGKDIEGNVGATVARLKGHLFTQMAADMQHPYQLYFIHG